MGAYAFRPPAPDRSGTLYGLSRLRGPLPDRRPGPGGRQGGAPPPRSLHLLHDVRGSLPGGSHRAAFFGCPSAHPFFHVLSEANVSSTLRPGQVEVAVSRAKMLKNDGFVTRD
jgi:hypothetical protein